MLIGESVSRHRATRLAWIPPNERVPPPDVAPQVVPNASQGDHPATAQEQAAVADESPCAPTTPLPTPVRSAKCQSYSMSFVTVAFSQSCRQSMWWASSPPLFCPHQPIMNLNRKPRQSHHPHLISRIQGPTSNVSRMTLMLADSFPSSPAPPPISKDVIEKLATDAGSLPYRSQGFCLIGANSMRTDLINRSKTVRITTLLAIEESIVVSIPKIHIDHSFIDTKQEAAVF
ncbi:hypothetical protein OSTOST_19992, partial [Ostertagia ostertagi]